MVFLSRRATLGRTRTVWRLTVKCTKLNNRFASRGRLKAEVHSSRFGAGFGPRREIPGHKGESEKVQFDEGNCWPRDLAANRSTREINSVGCSAKFRKISDSPILWTAREHVRERESRLSYSVPISTRDDERRGDKEKSQVAINEKERERKEEKKNNRRIEKKKP